MKLKLLQESGWIFHNPGNNNFEIIENPEKATDFPDHTIFIWSNFIHGYTGKEVEPYRQTLHSCESCVHWEQINYNTGKCNIFLGNDVSFKIRDGEFIKAVNTKKHFSCSSYKKQ